MALWRVRTVRRTVVMEDQNCRGREGKTPWMAGKKKEKEKDEML